VGGRRHNTRSLKRFLDDGAPSRASGPDLRKKSLSDRLQFSAPARANPKTGLSGETHCGIVIEKGDEHLVHGGVRKCAQQHRTGNALDNLRNDPRLAGARRSPDEVEHLAIDCPVNGLGLTAIEIGNGLNGVSAPISRSIPLKNRLLLFIHRGNQKIVQRVWLASAVTSLGKRSIVQSWP